MNAGECFGCPVKPIVAVSRIHLRQQMDAERFLKTRAKPANSRYPALRLDTRDCHAGPTVPVGSSPFRAIHASEAREWRSSVLADPASQSLLGRYEDWVLCRIRLSVAPKCTLFSAALGWHLEAGSGTGAQPKIARCRDNKKFSCYSSSTTVTQ